MSRRVIEKFVDDVWEALPQLRQALTTAFRFAGDRLALDKAQGVTHAIATGSSKLQLEGLAEVASAENLLLTRVQLGSLTFDRPLYDTLEQLTDLMESATSTALSNPAANSQLLEDLRRLISRHQSGSVATNLAEGNSIAAAKHDPQPVASTMPPSEWELFRNAANEQMREMARRLDLFRRDLNRWDVLADVRRRLHSLRTAARSGGLADFAGLAQHAEDLLQRMLDRSVPANESAADCLLATIDALEVRVAGGLDPAMMLQLHERLDEIAGERSRYAAELHDTFVAPPEEEPTRSEFTTDSAVSTTLDTAVVASQNIVLDDRSQLTGEMLEVFSEEADEHLTHIDFALTSLEQHPHRMNVVQDIRRSAHTLKGAAGAVQLRLVSKLSHRMEDLLERIVEAKKPVLPPTISLLHGTSDTLHDLVSGRFDPEPMRATVSQLFDRYDAALASFSADANGGQLLLPVNVGRALLPVVESKTVELVDSTRSVEERPVVEDAKPSTKEPSATKAAIEIIHDTIDDASEPIILSMPGASAIELISELPPLDSSSTFDVFIAPQMATGDVAQESPLVVTETTTASAPSADEFAADAWPDAELWPESELSRIEPAHVARPTQQSVEADLRSRSRETSDRTLTSLNTTRSATSSLAAESTEDLKPVATSANEIIVRDALPMLAAWNQRPLAEKIIDSATAEAAESGDKRPGETLRVPLDRVDSLVREVGELLINRTSFETRMSDFLQYVEDMQRAVERLRQASRDIDTKYGVEALGGRKHLMPEDATRSRRGSQKFSAKAREEFDALEMDRYTEFHLLSRTLSETTADIGTIALELRSVHGDFDQLLHRQGRLGRNTQDRLMRIRMVPLMQLAGRFQRTVRTVAEPQRKLVDFVIAGGETEVDKPVLEELADPLMHLLRNAVDHGIELPEARRAANKPERAAIRLQAFAQGTQIVLKISDDGSGLNVDAIRRTALRIGLIDSTAADTLSNEQLAAMIFLPGLSTADTINEISGRGIGMDIVAEKVRKLKGTISVESREGQGTTFTIRLPITLSVTRALLVSAANEMFALPLPTVVQILRVERQAIENLGRSPVLRLGEESLPLVFLADRLNLRQALDRLPKLLPVVVIASGDDKVALVVDKILASRDIVVKSLGSHLQQIPGLLGATLLGDGSVVPILDPAPLVEPTKLPADSISHRALASNWNAQAEQEQTASALQRISPEEPSMSHEFGNERTELLQPPVAEDIASPSEAPDQTLEPPVIMVVDDSVSVRRVTSNLLKKAGFLAIEAKDGLDALDKLRNAVRAPDLFLLDIEMPRMDGFDLLNSLRMTPAHRQTPVVMITSRAAEKHRTKARQLGANDYLVKPFHDEQLLTLIGSLLASPVA